MQRKVSFRIAVIAYQYTYERGEPDLKIPKAEMKNEEGILLISVAAIDIKETRLL